MSAKKDAYYFSHDANAQDDPKCMILIDQLGMEGYGIFWALVEKLRSEKDYKLPFMIIPSLARRWGTSKEKVESVVKLYGLFSVVDDLFFSERLLRSMNEKSEKARLSATYRWNKDRNNAVALQSHTDGIADGMQNDAIKVKKSKVKKSKVDIVLPHSVSFHKVWNEWIEFRKEIKKPLAESSIKKQIAFLSEKGEEEAIKILNKSIQNQWQGLFEINEKSKQSPVKDIPSISTEEALKRQQQQAAKYQ